MEVFKSEKFDNLTLNVVKNNTNDFQLIYASQLYGSFFAVGGKLIVENKSLVDIELTLNNYKGLYNIGILLNADLDWDIKGKTGNFNLHLQVDNGKNAENLTTKRKVGIKKPIALNKIDSLLVDRVLYPLSQSKPARHLHENLFDNEFYVRNGSYIGKIPRLDDYIPEANNHILGGSPLSNCMRTKSNLI